MAEGDDNRTSTGGITRSLLCVLLVPLLPDIGIVVSLKEQKGEENSPDSVWGRSLFGA